MPKRIAPPEHNISRAAISANALKVLRRLNEHDYQAYLVGGGVRDLLLGREPKDFDIATEATPEQVRKLFRNCRLIGRRFRLAHVLFGREIIEVATFRGSGDGDEEDDDNPLRTQSDEGRLLRDNIYGSIEEDAIRRDFTVNALFYDAEQSVVIDYVGGLDDLNAGVLRLIGDPEQRYREDPVRMLRAVRFAAKLGFRIHADTEGPLFELGHLLADISPSRLFDEVLKLFMGGCAVQTFELLRHYNLFQYLFPQTEQSLTVEEQHFPLMLVANGMASTDTRIAEGKPVTPAFLFACLLWEPVRLRTQQLIDEGVPTIPAMQQAAGEVASQQARATSIPKRFSMPMREIWNLQPRLHVRSGNRPFRLLDHPRFRAAYDFLVLRAESGEADPELAQWWTEFQATDEPGRKRMLQPDKSKRRRRRKRRKPRGGGNPGDVSDANPSGSDS